MNTMGHHVRFHSLCGCCDWYQSNDSEFLPKFNIASKSAA